MARARNIKPGMYKNEDLAECSIWARYIFPGMWMLADREGRLEDRPKRIKSELLPYDSVEVDSLLDELVSWGFIIRYVVDGQGYIQILKFIEHQTPHVREQASSIPNPSQGLIKVSAGTTLGSALPSPRSPDSLNPSSLNPSSLNPSSLNPGKHPLSNPSTDPEEIDDLPDLASSDENDLLGSVPQKVPKLALSKPGPAEQVFQHWQTVMGHPQAKLDAKRKRNIAARLKDGYTVEQLERAIEGCKYDPWSQGANDRNTVFDDIELICRDGVRVDRYIKIAMRGPPKAHDGMSNNTRQQVENLKRYMEQNTDDNRNQA